MNETLFKVKRFGKVCAVYQFSGGIWYRISGFFRFKRTAYKFMKNYITEN